MNIFEVGNLYEAVQMADGFRKEGRYDWFRGQQEVLPPTPTYLRLDEKEVGDAKERLRHYCNWMSNTPGLESLSQNIDGAIAVAQHYGLRTLMAVRVLSHSVDAESEKEPPLIYERDQSMKNGTRRPYRIFLRQAHSS